MRHGSGTSASSTFYFETLKRLNVKWMVRGLPSRNHVEQFCDVRVLPKQRQFPFPQQLSF
jgi:hypothetical protein